MFSANTEDRKINTSRFYTEWQGHPIQDLERFHGFTLAERPDKPIIYLAGDSSLDNKYWVHKSTAMLDTTVPYIYNAFLTRAEPKPDVAFWMNHLLGERATCINAAVEASMLRQRGTELLPHDDFIKNHIRSQDILIVSVGANDVALSPNASTTRNMLQLAWLTPQRNIENGSAWALPHFRRMFGTQTQHYISRLISVTKPRAVIVCMIYFPLESQFGQASWAHMQLTALGYNSNPGKLQAAIRTIYEGATKKIEVEGTELLPCALFEVLNGKNSEAYEARVEPNEDGGRKMAVRFMELVEEVWSRDAAL